MKIALRSAALLAFAIACVSFLPVRLANSAYPDKPIRIIVGFPPGGTADILARIVARELVDAWSQPVVIDNRPGAGSFIGSELAARSAPDGYTLLVVTSSHVVTSSVASDKAGFDPVNSFSPISLLASTPLSIAGTLSLPARNMRDLLAYAKANPGKLNYGSSGNGSTTHLAGELLNNMAGIRLVHVAYRGGAASMNDVVGGQIHLVVISLPSTVPQMKAGRVIGLAVTTAKRSPSAPELPTLAESGVPGYEATQWYAMLAPAGTPAAIVDKLNAQVVRIVRDPKIAEIIASSGAEPVTATPRELRAYMRAEFEKWSRIAQLTGTTGEIGALGR